jgi:acyl carrier protein
MARAEVFAKIRDVLSDLADKPDLQITEATTAQDVDEWDSVNHVKLIIAIETDYKVRFTPDEISNLNNVGDLVDLTEKKLGNR